MNKEIILKLIQIHLAAQNYMQMIYYINGKLYSRAMDTIAHSLAELTDYEHWEDFVYEAAELEPNAVMTEVAFEIRELDEKFRELFPELKELPSMTETQMEIFVNILLLTNEFAADKKASIDAALDILIKNRNSLSKEDIQQLVATMMENGMFLTIDLFGKALGIVFVTLPQGSLEDAEEIFEQLKREADMKPTSGRKPSSKGGAGKKELLN